MRAGPGVGVVSLGLLAAWGGSSGSSPTPVPSATPPTASCAAGAPVAGVPALTGRLVASGLHNPLDLQAAPGDRERLYVVEQGGRIRIIRGGQLQSTPFLDVSGRISSGGERGLLGLAFHPQLRDGTANLRGVNSPASFGSDAEGEVYVVDYDGEVYRLEPAS
jgi:hypothetical protein